MQVYVNGKPCALDSGATIRDLLLAISLGDTLVAVERNEHVVPRADHASTDLQDGDEIEVVHFVGGG